MEMDKKTALTKAIPDLMDAWKKIQKRTEWYQNNKLVRLPTVIVLAIKIN